jgi:lipoprotein-releasing system permease protein
MERQLAHSRTSELWSPPCAAMPFLIRGEKRLGVVISGGDPPAQEKIVTLQEDIIAGRWLDIGPDDIVLGWRLADEMGLKLGDTVRVSSSRNVTASYRVAGIFDTGNNQLDRNQPFSPACRPIALWR